MSNLQRAYYLSQNMLMLVPVTPSPKVRYFIASLNGSPLIPKQDAIPQALNLPFLLVPANPDRAILVEVYKVLVPGNSLLARAESVQQYHKDRAQWTHDCSDSQECLLDAARCSLGKLPSLAEIAYLLAYGDPYGAF